MAQRLYVVVTYSYDAEVMETLADKLLAKGVPSAHVTKTDSWYRWEGKKINATEYKLDVLCTKEMLSDVVATVRKNHNYSVPPITWYEVHTDADTFIWAVSP